jgi:mRNA interferase RelE/StbE
MSYKVIIKGSAKKELKRIDYQMHDRIIEHIMGLQENPRPMGCEKLGGQDSYRIRIGDYRVAFTIDDKAKLVEIIKIGDRKEIYKKR